MVGPQLAKAAATTWPIDVMANGIPKICAYAGADAAANRALQQVGVFHVIGRGGGGMPWTEEALRKNIADLEDVDAERVFSRQPAFTSCAWRSKKVACRRGCRTCGRSRFRKRHTARVANCKGRGLSRVVYFCR